MFACSSLVEQSEELTQTHTDTCVPHNLVISDCGQWCQSEPWWESATTDQRREPLEGRQENRSNLYYLTPIDISQAMSHPKLASPVCESSFLHSLACSLARSLVPVSYHVDCFLASLPVFTLLEFCLSTPVFLRDTTGVWALPALTTQFSLTASQATLCVLFLGHFSLTYFLL